ncbi:MAG: F0F1 ATP synthase subunit delta, partial [Puniceicoccales bacterium]
IEEVLSTLRANPPRDHRAILQYLSFLAEREIAASTARVVSGKALSADSIEKIRKSFSDKYGRSLAIENREDPSLIAGTRVQVGDDVYEISIPSRLAAISSASR